LLALLFGIVSFLLGCPRCWALGWGEGVDVHGLNQSINAVFFYEAVGAKNAVLTFNGPPRNVARLDGAEALAECAVEKLACAGIKVGTRLKKFDHLGFVHLKLLFALLMTEL